MRCACGHGYFFFLSTMGDKRVSMVWAAAEVVSGVEVVVVERASRCCRITGDVDAEAGREG